MHEHGLPSYPPDEDDTPLTYPLEFYACSRSSGQLADAAVTEPTQGPQEDLVIKASLLDTDRIDAEKAFVQTGIDRSIYVEAPEGFTVDQELVGEHSGTSSTCSLSTASTYYVPLEDALRACGIIERSWIWYAVEILGSDICVTAQNLVDSELYIAPPPYRFVVNTSETYEFVKFVDFDADSLHLLDGELDELLRA